MPLDLPSRRPTPVGPISKRSASVNSQHWTPDRLTAEPDAALFEAGRLRRYWQHRQVQNDSRERSFDSREAAEITSRLAAADKLELEALRVLIAQLESAFKRMDDGQRSDVRRAAAVEAALIFEIVREPDPALRREIQLVEGRPGAPTDPV